MIPLINVVFLMLAFLMIAGEVRKTEDDVFEEQIDLMLPESKSQREREDHHTVLFLDQSNRIYLDRQLVELSELETELRERSTTVRQFDLMVQADARVPAQDTQEVLKIVRSAGILRVSLATITTSIQP
ncbi:MAG: biopolymer transporter ExbD [Gammaproteobacteria bacterium]|nr:biopolymer transporter ExbD [Gammaproteobacteria bacterium]MDE0252844.1 biopolymer transporter ExbD [Gammaproteobacteria bacterium]